MVENGFAKAAAITFDSLAIKAQTYTVAERFVQEHEGIIKLNFPEIVGSPAALLKEAEREAQEFDVPVALLAFGFTIPRGDFCTVLLTLAALRFDRALRMIQLHLD